MSKEHLLRLALEGDVGPATSEDEALAFADIVSDLNANQTVIAEIERAEEVRGGLIDLGRVAQSLESADLTQLALIQIASNMATIGTRASCEDIFPTLESAQGTRVSTESLAETAKQLWERILAALKNLVNSFAKFWDSVVGEVERIQAANNRLAARAKGMQGRAITNESVDIGRARTKFEINGTLVKTAPALAKALVIARSQLKVVTGFYVDNVIKCGESLQSAASLEKVTAEDYLQATLDAALHVDYKSMASLIGARPYVDSRFSIGEVVAGMPLLGNRSIFINAEGHGQREVVGILGLAERCRARRAMLTMSSTGLSQNIGDSNSIQTFSAGDIIGLCREVDAILDMIKSFVRGSKRAQLSRLNTGVLNSIDKAQKRLYVPGLGDRDAVHYRSAARFATAFTSWSQNPHDSLCTHLLSVCRAVILVSNNSIDLHR